jgi:hypothetical protein
MRANTLPALFSTVGPSSRTRGHDLKLVMQSTISRVYPQFFSSQIVKSWYKLSKETFTAESVDVFKQRLDAEWLSKECKLNWDPNENPTAPSH